MIVVSDLCGDEDDYYLTYEFFMAALKMEIYNQLINFDPRKPND